MPGYDPRKRSLLEIHLAVFLFGFPGLFGKWLALPPSLIVLGRVVFASLALGIVLRLTRVSFRVRPSRDLILFALCGLILSVHWTMFFKSIQVSSVAIGLLSYSSFPVFTAVLEPFVLKERPDSKSLVFALICIFGVYLIIPRIDFTDSAVQGVIWGLGAGLTFSVLTLLNRGLVQRHSNLVVAFYQDAFAALFLAPVAVFSSFRLSARSFLLLALLGIFCTAAAHSLFIKGMKHIQARTAAIISSLEPAYGIVLAFWFLGEIPSLRTLAGGTIILVAALTVSLRAKRTS
jgi:drug/metabolite transporter (DMT)-like permease